MKVFSVLLPSILACCSAHVLHRSGNQATRHLRKPASPSVDATAGVANHSGGRAVGHSVCNVSRPEFNEDLCVKYTTGRTLQQIKDEYRHGLASIGLVNSSSNSRKQAVPPCQKLAYVWSFEQFETLFPELAQCHITTYALIVATEAIRYPCQSAAPENADVLMVPPYLGLECNWPGYGGGDCYNAANMQRHGYLCGTQVTAAVAKVQSTFPGKPVLLVDDNSLWEVYNLPAAEYSVAGRIFAKSNTLTNFYRQGTDISLPPPPFPRCTMTPSKAYEEPVTSKNFFVSFKGAFNTHHIRQAIQTMHHNGKDQIIVDSSDYVYDFDALLQQSRFVLILRGHVEFSYRFNEAVCSGGVPVLVTDKWVPPFNEIIPFQNYGVLVHESDIGGLIKILKAIPDGKVEELRRNARLSCTNAFSTVEATTRSLLQYLSPR